MNPLTNMKNVQKLSEAELKGRNKTSWHDQYRGSAWLFVGGLPYDLTEGDIICVFSQYGEPVNINLVRDKDTGRSKGFCFICYEDQRSTDLAVDNLNGMKLLGRTIRVDHVDNYKPPKERKDDDDDTKALKRGGLAGIAVRAIEKEKTVKVEDRKEVPSKRKKVAKKMESESESDDSASSPKRAKKKGKKEKNCDKRRKKQKESSSSSSSSESESSSSSEEDVPRKRKKKYETTSESDSSVPDNDIKSHKKRRKHKDNSKVDQSKRGTIKHSKTIDELKREAKLIQEELIRRQKAKDEIENNSIKKNVKYQYANEDKKRHHRDLSKQDDRHRHECRVSNEQKERTHESKWHGHEKHNNLEKSKKDNQPIRRRNSSDSSSNDEQNYPEKRERPAIRHPHNPNTRRSSPSPEKHHYPKMYNDRGRNRSRSNERHFNRSGSPEHNNSRYKGKFSGRNERFDRGRDYERNRYSPRRNRR